MAAEICTQSQNHMESKSEGDRLDAIKEVLATFKLSDKTEPNSSRPGLLEVVNRMDAQMDQGLCKEGNATSDIKMFPTFVEQLPTGKETGEYLALDLGGTWFRVLFFRLNGRGGIEFAAAPHVQAIPKAIMLGHGVQFFDFIVLAIDTMLNRLESEGQISNDGNSKKDFPMGFTFSFPCRNTAIDQAILARWTKGFACEGVAGNDVVKMLHEARDRKKDMKFTFHCSCLINDTVGCLTSLALSKPNTRVGVIYGTGTNACFPEPIENISTLGDDFDRTQDPDAPKRKMLINTEWGGFGSVSHSLDDVRNTYDQQLDRESLNRGDQLYEKMISGMYMGEILRLLLVDLVKLGLLLPDVHDHESLARSELFQKNQLHTKYLSEIENDPMPRHPARNMMGELGVDELLVSDMDCDIIHAACEAVSGRAARMAAIGLAVALKRVDPPKDEITIIGVDGSLVRFHRHFRQVLESKTRDLLDLLGREDIQFAIELSEDGSGLGTAAVAAAAERPSATS